MTLGELLDRVDILRPNAWSREQKCAWVSDLEAMIWTQIFLQPHGLWAPYKHETDGEARLLLPDTWRRLYTAYLGAMIDLADGEYERYQNGMSLYNGILAEVGAWYADAFNPAGQTARWARLGLAAYDRLAEEAMVLALPGRCGLLALSWKPLAAADGTGRVRFLSEAGEPVWQEVDIINGETSAVRRLGLQSTGENRKFLLLKYSGEAITSGCAEVWALVQPEKRK